MKLIKLIGASALLLAAIPAAAIAQQAPDESVTPDEQQDGMPAGSQGMMSERQPGMMDHPGRGMVGHGMMGRGMMGHGMMDGGMMGRGMMGPDPMRIMFILMDTDGDGALSLEEVQAVHERIFQAIDEDDDGRVTPEETRAFMRGTTSPAAD